MLRRPALTAVAAALFVALALPASALAIHVHVRVEGVRTTIFGPSQQVVRPMAGHLTVGDVSLDLPVPTALGALEAASVRGDFYYRLVATSFGPYVAQIGRDVGSDSSGWVFKVNGVSPPVGADSYALKDGDIVLWYYAAFGPAGGPPTLDLVRLGGGCFRADAVDDLGKRTPARAVVFRVDNRLAGSADGHICPAGHWHRLRATKDGAVRSQVVGPR